MLRIRRQRDRRNALQREISPSFGLRTRIHDQFTSSTTDPTRGCLRPLTRSPVIQRWTIGHAEKGIVDSTDPGSRAFKKCFTGVGG